VALGPAELPPLPDEIGVDPDAGRLDPRAWFPEPRAPLEIEIGSGKGTFLLEQGAAEPGTNFLGLERAREFFLYAADRVRRRGLRNVRLACADGAEFLHWRCPPAVRGGPSAGRAGGEVVRVIHLYFSDPWPKKRHHKNRVIRHRFLADAWRVLVPGGELRVVTDHDGLWEWNLSHFAVWTDPARFEAWRQRGALDGEDAVRAAELPPAADAAPFTIEPFAPVPWAGEGMLVGTNYERKMDRRGGHEAGSPHGPHAATLRKRGGTNVGAG
jgi:tRNA (guanine-N7-)-methyltransferase